MDNDCFTINIHFSFFLQPNLSDFYSYSEFFDHVVNKRVSYDINTLFMFDPRLEDIFCGILTSNLRRTYTVMKNGFILSQNRQQLKLSDQKNIYIPYIFVLSSKLKCHKKYLKVGGRT